MKTQGYLNPVANLTQGISSNLNAKPSEKSGEFDTIMHQNLANHKNHLDSVFEKREQSVEASKSKIVKDKYKTVDDTKESSKIPSKSSVVNEAKEAVSNAISNRDNTGVTDSIPKEELEAIAEKINTAVTEILGLTKEELELLLTQQGFTLGDLVDLESLKELVLAASGSEDVMEFVTNGDLIQTLQRLEEAVDGILEQSMMDLSDDEWNRVLNSLDQALSTEEASFMENTIAVEEIGKKQQSNQENIHLGKSQLEEASSSSSKVEVINLTETGDLHHTGEEASSQGDLNKQNNSDSYGTFLENLNQVHVQTKIEYQPDGIRVVDVSEIANQILEKIRVTIKPDQTSMEMQLNPENLGKVNLSVQSKAGVLTAQFVVQNEVAKEAIESQLHQLRDTLNQQGVKVEAIEVTVASYNFDQNAQAREGGQSKENKNQKTQKITLEEALGMTEEIVEESILAQDMTGTNIDMTA